MYKNIFVILVLFFMIGCDNSNPLSSELYRHNDFEIDKKYISLDVLELKKDLNGYYTGKFVFPDNAPYGMFFTLRAETDYIDSQILNWNSNCFITVDHPYEQWVEFVDLVNDSTTVINEYGESFNTLSVWPNFIGDTITVYSNFISENQIMYQDRIKIILKW